MSDFDPEAIEAERLDADIEMAELEASARAFGRLTRAAAKAYAQGNLAAAARLCPHGSGYPLRSIAAQDNNDPAQGRSGVRCTTCGSILTDWQEPFGSGARVIEPCSITPRFPKEPTP